MHRIVTLTTDFGYNDYFVGSIKGNLYSALSSEVSVVDISHSVNPFNIRQAAYIIKNSYHHFPKGSIHIIGVDTERTPQVRHLVMHYKEHYFIGADNGIFSLLVDQDDALETEDTLPEIIEISHPRKGTFPSLSVFNVVAIHIAKGNAIKTLGGQVKNVKFMKFIPPFINTAERIVKGAVVHIDRYGNCVSNISRETIQQMQKQSKIEIGVNQYDFDAIYNNFSDFIYNHHKNSIGNEGRKIAFYNNLDYLAIAIYRGNVDTIGAASTLLGIELGTTVRVNFNPS